MARQYPPRVDRLQPSRKFDIRPISLKTYEFRLTQYVSYLLTAEQPPITTWNELFDPQRLQRFLQWHAARMGVARISPSGKQVAQVIVMIAAHEQRPEIPALKAVTHKLPTPEPMHDKQRPEHSITPQKLESVGLTLLTEVRQSLTTAHIRTSSVQLRSLGGSKLAANHGKALILRLLVRIPLRQRNIREMELGKNLYQDHNGIWQLHFQGEDLKIGARSGRTNTLHMPFPPDLVQHLEEYLKCYRPLLFRGKTPPHVFLHLKGKPYEMNILQRELFLQMYGRTGKRFYPYLIRTIWTDKFLLKTHDVSTAAYMLNDRPETVLKRYHELRANNHIEKAYNFTQSLLESPIMQ